MPRTVWYPGHMAKGRRQLEALASAVDLLIEVRDARAPRHNGLTVPGPQRHSISSASQACCCISASSVAA